jgi:hypothetical protein
MSAPTPEQVTRRIVVEFLNVLSPSGWQRGDNTPDEAMVSVSKLMNLCEVAIAARAGELEAQCAALREALRRVMVYQGAEDEDATEQEASREQAMAALADTSAAAAQHDERLKAQGVYEAWMHGWRDQPHPDAMDQPTMAEAVEFVRALLPGTARAGSGE